MEFFVYCRDKPGTARLREELGEAHWSYMDGFADAMIARGPTLTPDREMATGSLHIVDLPDAEAALAFTFEEPYYRAGVFREPLVRRWRNELGGTMWDYVSGEPAAPIADASNETHRLPIVTTCEETWRVESRVIDAYQRRMQVANHEAGHVVSMFLYGRAIEIDVDRPEAWMDGWVVPEPAPLIPMPPDGVDVFDWVDAHLERSRTEAAVIARVGSLVAGRSSLCSVAIGQVTRCRAAF